MAEDRQELLAHYRRSRAELLAAIDGLSDAQLCDPSIDGWSVKDHLAHLAFWDDIRAAEVQRFQTDPGCKLFLVSLKAGGFGLNLTAADYVFLLDPWWNPASEAQAIDRAHRIGQTRNVMAYRLIARGTVEERVLELQSRKRNLAQAILTEDNALLRDLTREDLARLLS